MTDDRIQDSYNEEVAAIQAGIDDMEAGRVQSLREFDREFRRRKNMPPRCDELANPNDQPTTEQTG